MTECETGRYFSEIVEDTPYAYTCPATATSIFTGTPFKYVFSYTIRVRSMGASTYVGIGTEWAQEYRLTAAGQTLSFTSNPGEVVNLSKKYVISDGGDAVIEVMSSSLPVRHYGCVRKVH